MISAVTLGMCVQLGNSRGSAQKEPEVELRRRGIGEGTCKAGESTWERGGGRGRWAAIKEGKGRADWEKSARNLGYRNLSGDLCENEIVNREMDENEKGIGGR